MASSIPGIQVILFLTLAVCCFAAPPRRSFWSEPPASTHATLLDEREYPNSIWDEDEAFELDGDEWLKQSPGVSQSKWYGRDELSRPPDFEDSEEDNVIAATNDDDEDSDEIINSDEYVESEVDNGKRSSPLQGSPIDNDTLKLRHAGRTHQEDSEVEESYIPSHLDDDDDSEEESYDLISYSDLDGGDDSKEDDNDEVDVSDDDNEDERDDAFATEDEDEPLKVFEDRVLLF